MRFYFTGIRGQGLESDPFYCPLNDTQASKKDFLDGREFPEIEDGWFFVWTDNTDLEHAAALLEADITYLPTEGGSGLVDLDSSVSQITAANKAAILAEIESKGIPTDGITGATTIREAMRTIIKRIRLMEQLRYVDLGDLTGTVGDMQTLKKKAMRRRLINMGFDLTNITNATTVRAALNNLIDQNLGPLKLLPF